MKRALAIAAGTLTLVGAAAPDQPISFSLNYWGRPLVQWRIDPDGHVDFSYIGNTSRIDQAKAMTTGKTLADRSRYQAIAQILAPVRAFAGKQLPCTRAITDMPYGAVQWGSGPAVSFDGGFNCPTEEGKAAMRAITEANKQVEAWVVPPN